jgi:WD repeat-containing protein 19
VVLRPDKAEIPAGNTVLLSVSGQLTTENSTGGLNMVVHPYFDQMHEKRVDGRRPNSKGVVPAVQRTRFCQALALNKLEDAWQAALDLEKREFWLALSGKAMEMMNVELAIRVYRQVGDAGMVMSLQKCLHMEDKHLLGGYISLFFSDYHRAQELFLLSSSPVAALDMQCDLMRWDQALKLAHNLSPDRVPLVSVKYGQQLEFRDESEKALRLFESALNFVDENGMGLCPEALTPVAMAGIARCNLRQGNIRQGIRLASEVDTPVLYAECGDILEQHKQYSEAASMFIKANNHEKAAEIYVRHLITQDKNRLNEAIALFAKVSNSHLNTSLAKACISAGRYDEAAKAYERAKDYDKVYTYIACPCM